MPNIRHTVFIGAPVEKVYRAITSEEGLSAWWTPDTKVTSQTNAIARFAFGPAYFKEMKIIELKPLEQVKWFCISGLVNSYRGCCRGLDRPDSFYTIDLSRWLNRICCTSE